MQTPLASLSLDLDDKWTYMQTHGDAGWKSFPSYLELAVPRILAFLGDRDLQITFFVVGQDAALARNREPLAAIAEAGHEIASHSFHHRPWLHLFSEREIDAELAAAEEHIERVTNQRPRGFRGPGFSISLATLRVLSRRGYDYDATTFPNLLNPLARMYFLAKSNLSTEERDKRGALFGSWSDALRPNQAFAWKLGERSLLEIPVTTMPLVRVPIHFSYVVYLGTFSKLVARAYFRTALALCRLTRTEPSLLLHPLDFLGSDDERDLDFFPGMKAPAEPKLGLLGDCLDMLARRFRVVPMRQHVGEVERRGPLRILEPDVRPGQASEA